MDLSELISKKVKKMGIAELINKEKKTAFSFEVLPPLKGTGIEKLYATIDTLREFDPLYVNITTHRSEYVYRELGVVYMNVIVIGGVRVRWRWLRLYIINMISLLCRIFCAVGFHVKTRNIYCLICNFRYY